MRFKKKTSAGKVQDYLKLELAYQTTTLRQIFEQCIATQFQIIGGHIEQLIVERSEYERRLNQTVQQGKAGLWALDAVPAMVFSELMRDIDYFIQGCSICMDISLQHIFLPFEYDERLNLILSKILLLIADDQIQDQLILKQI